MDNKRNLLIGALVIFLLGLGAGYAITPTETKTITETKVVEKEVVKWKEKTTTEKKSDKVTIIVETKYPDGTVRKETKIVDKGTLVVDAEKSGSVDKEKSSDTKTETETKRGLAQWKLGAVASASHAGDNVLGTPTSFGVSLDKRIIGPIWGSAFVISNKTIGVGLGVEF